MTLAQLLAQARTCRRFDDNLTLTAAVLADLVDMTRFAPSARNRQPLRYVLVASPELREAMHGLVTMGGGLKPEQRAGDHQRPGGYIVILGPDDLGDFGLMDVGIAAQTINLAANAAGLACCIVGAFNKPGLEKLLPSLPALEGLRPLLVLALGRPGEERQICPVPEGGSTAYFRDDHNVHWVPKLDLSTLVAATL